MDPYLEIGEAGDQEWDEFLRAHPEGHHEQSGAYGRERKSWGFACDRVAVREGGRLVGGAMALPRSSPAPVTSRLPSDSFPWSR